MGTDLGPLAIAFLAAFAATWSVIRVSGLQRVNAILADVLFSLVCRGVDVTAAIVRLAWKSFRAGFRGLRTWAILKVRSAKGLQITTN